MSVWPSGAWPAALARASAGIDVAEVVVVGDSLTLGGRSSDYRTKSMWGRTAANLRSLYGHGGDGFCPWPWGTITGTTTTAFATGPNGHVVILDSTDRWSLADLDGTRIDVLLRRVSGGGTARWRVDEGDWQSVSCAGTTGWIRATVTGLDPGLHTVDVEASSGTVAVFGAESRNPTGVRLHTMGLGLRRAQDVDDANFTTPSIAEYQPHLLCVALGLNDSNLGSVTGSAFHDSVEVLIQAARTERADCDVLLVANHLGAFDDNNYDDMIAALSDLVDEYGGVVVDLDTWARTDQTGTLTDRTDTDPTGTSWGRWNTWGWMADLTDEGPSGADSVHPGDTGHFVLSQILTSVLTTPEVPVVEPEPEIEDGGVVS